MPFERSKPRSNGIFCPLLYKKDVLILHSSMRNDTKNLHVKQLKFLK